MKRFILLFFLLLLMIIWGCSPNDSVTSPQAYTILADPTSMTFNGYSSKAMVQERFYINITVNDEKAKAKSGQELFFYCSPCASGAVQLRDNAQNVIDVTKGTVHGVTGDAGNYILWVYVLVNSSINYVDEIRITSGTNDLHFPLTVTNTRG